MSTTAPAPADHWQNLFGVCACLGEDFGFNPIFLRVLFGMSLIFAPVIVVSTYFGLGVLVLVSRLVFPNRRVAPAKIDAVPAKVSAIPAVGVEDMPLPLAA